MELTMLPGDTDGLLDGLLVGKCDGMQVGNPGNGVGDDIGCSVGMPGATSITCTVGCVVGTLENVNTVQGVVEQATVEAIPIAPFLRSSPAAKLRIWSLNPILLTRSFVPGAIWIRSYNVVKTLSKIDLSVTVVILTYHKFCFSIIST